MEVFGQASIAALKMLRGYGRKYLRASSGTTAMMFAISMPALMAAVGVASDYGIYNMKRTSLQNAADQAAIASAKELALSTSNTKTQQEVVDAYVLANLGEAGAHVDTTVAVSANKSAVTVRLEETWSPFFAHFIGAKIMPIVVSAKASLQGESKICVLAVANSGSGAISMTHDSSIVAKGCSVYSNSTNAAGIFLGDDAKIDANLVCSAGGVRNNSGSSTGNVTTDCPQIPDPLATRPVPKFGGCDKTNFKLNSGSTTLDPGVYCGGIQITGKAQVTFNPGDYIIKDGEFMVAGAVLAKGTDVGFYLTGSKALINFIGNAEIDLSGRVKGELAGLLFFEDPKSAPLRVHKISASNAHTLTGTIYLPKGSLLVDPNSKVGENSAYTAIIVRRLQVQNGPSLVLNSNYSATTVPVPEGIVTSNQVVLVE